MKKGIVQSVWITILLSLVVVVLILSFASFLGNIQDKQDRVALLDFVERLNGDVQKTRDNYGTVKVEDYYVGSMYKTICFAEHGNANPEGTVHEKIKDILVNKVEKNVFIYSDSEFESFYIDRIFIENSSDRILCYNLSKGYVNLRLEARGIGTLIGPSNASLSFANCVIKVPDIMNSGQLNPDLWDLNQKYFQKQGGKIISACGEFGWENVTVIKSW